jgi:SnoaL-like domain
VRWAEADPELVREQFTASTGDPAFADHALAYWASLIKQPEQVTHTVEQLTGVPARTFRDWAREHAGEFRPRSPAEVVSRYVSLLRRGELAGALTLLAPDVVRTAPLEGTRPLEGIEAIMANGRRQTAGYQIRGVEIDGPYPHAERFAVRFAFDEVHIPTGTTGVTEKMSVYAVRDSAIVSEDVYYHTPPHAP